MGNIGKANRLESVNAGFALPIVLELMAAAVLIPWRLTRLRAPKPDLRLVNCHRVAEFESDSFDPLYIWGIVLDRLGRTGESI